MCKYITLVIQPKIDIRKFEHIFSAHHLASSSVVNQSTKKQYGEDTNIIFPTKDHCDCGSVIGISSNHLSEEEVHNRLEQEINKLKQKGWSETKIQRWLKDNSKNKERNNNAERRNEECNNWISFFKEMFKNKEIRKISIFAHWYHGLIETEKVSLKEHKVIHINELNNNVLSNLPYDTPLKITQ